MIDLKNSKGCLLGTVNNKLFYPIVHEADGNFIIFKSENFEFKFTNTMAGLNSYEIVDLLKPLLKSIYGMDITLGCEATCIETDTKIILVPVAEERDNKKVWQLGIIGDLGILRYPYKYDLETDDDLSQDEAFDKLCHLNHIDK